MSEDEIDEVLDRTTLEARRIQLVEARDQVISRRELWHQHAVELEGGSMQARQVAWQGVTAASEQIAKLEKKLAKVELKLAKMPGD
ncbi:MAG: hypothetical protein ACO1N6_09355 [Microcella sp.]